MTQQEEEFQEQEMIRLAMERSMQDSHQWSCAHNATSSSSRLPNKQQKDHYRVGVSTPEPIPEMDDLERQEQEMLEQAIRLSQQEHLASAAQNR
jgi:hypothetical protein